MKLFFFFCELCCRSENDCCACSINARIIFVDRSRRCRVYLPKSIDLNDWNACTCNTVFLSVCKSHSKISANAFHLDLKTTFILRPKNVQSLQSIRIISCHFLRCWKHATRLKNHTSSEQSVWAEERQNREKREKSNTRCKHDRRIILYFDGNFIMRSDWGNVARPQTQTSEWACVRMW